MEEDLKDSYYFQSLREFNENKNYKCKKYKLKYDD